MASKLSQLKHVISYYSFLLVIWGFFRALFKLPEPIEELFLKPVIWLIPLVIILRKEGLGLESLGWTYKGLMKSIFYVVVGGGLIYMGVVFALGLIFGDNLDKLNLISMFAEKRGILLGGFGISIVTAIVEETAFRGFIFNRFLKIFGDEFLASLINVIAWVLIHIPVFIFVYHMGTDDLLLRGILSGVFALGAGYLFARTRNILPSIFLHIFWPWVLILLG